MICYQTFKIVKLIRVQKIFIEFGKKLQKKGTECFNEIVAHFGEEILDEKGEDACFWYTRNVYLKQKPRMQKKKREKAEY